MCVIAGPFAVETKGLIDLCMPATRAVIQSDTRLDGTQNQQAGMRHLVVQD